MGTLTFLAWPGQGTTTLGAGLVLISWWKAILLIAPVVGWAWMISTFYDKHAARFHLGNQRWNAIHLSAGLLAVALGMGVPALAGIEGILGFIIGWFLLVLVLAIDLTVYPVIANRDPRVPEAHRLRISFESIKEARRTKAEAKQAGTVELAIAGPDKTVFQAPSKETPEYALRIAAEQIVIKARQARASQLDIAPSGKESAYSVSFLIDGVRQASEAIPAPDALRIIDFWKQAGKLDVADRRRRQRADLRIAHHEDQFPVRMTTIGGQAGVRLSMLFNFAEAVRRSVDHLGLVEGQREELDRIVQNGSGVVLVAAPPHAGRTTLLYTVVKMHDAYTRNVQLLELDAQDSLEGARQNIFDPLAEGPEYSKVLRSILRRDPDVVGVAELDAEAAKEICRADLERVRIYVSVKAEGALEAIQLWARGVEDLATAGDALHGVVAGRLLRRLCENCRVAYQPAPDMLRKLGLPEDKVKQLYKKGGQVLVKNKPEICPVCNGIGYSQQEGIFEVYAIGPEERRLIKEGNLQGLKAELRKKRLPTIQQAALRKAVDGITSIEEVLRVTSDVKARAPGAQGPQQAAATNA